MDLQPNVLTDCLGRDIPDSTIVYIGEVEYTNDVYEFKDKFRGNTPKNGFYMAIGELRYNDNIFNEVLYPRIPHIGDSILKQINSNYFGMQFIKTESKYYYLFLVKDEKLDFFTYIKKGSVSLMVIRTLLNMMGYEEIDHLKDTINMKNIIITYNDKLNRIVSIKSDGRMYNNIVLLQVKTSGNRCYWESTNKTSEIFKNGVEIQDHHFEKIPCLNAEKLFQLTYEHELFSDFEKSFNDHCYEVESDRLYDFYNHINLSF